MRQSQGGIDGRQDECLLAKLTGQVFDDGYLRGKEVFSIDGHFLPVLTALDVDLGHYNLVEHLHEVHIGGFVECLVVLYGLAPKLVLEVQEEACRYVLVGAALVEHLKDALTAVVGYLLLGSDGLNAGGCKQNHG